jgi:hypothetical protein
VYFQPEGFRLGIRDLMFSSGSSVETYSAEATRSWLMARNRLIGFDRPIDRFGHGDFAAVREATEAFVDGDYT